MFALRSEPVDNCYMTQSVKENIYICSLDGAVVIADSPPICTNCKKKLKPTGWFETKEEEEDESEDATKNNNSE